jgi:hypothetical protein
MPSNICISLKTVILLKKRKRGKWTQKQKKLLPNGQVKRVRKNIEKIAPENEAVENLISYYQTNSHRMDYKTYQQLGYGIIGSGAIESVHRTVVQKRMKQSCQRWAVLVDNACLI